MQWTKIPTNLLINRLSDQEIVAIVKYQLLWADLEYQPDDKTALRYLSNKQLTIAMQWLNAIDTQVTRDIRSSEMNRNSVKLNYLKNKDKSENLSISLNNSLSNSLDEQIRLDKNKEIYKEKFEEFYKSYPRKESRLSAEKSFIRVLKEKKATFDELMEGVRKYSDKCIKEKTEQKYIKHPSTWLNQGCWADEYEDNYTSSDLSGFVLPNGEVL